MLAFGDESMSWNSISQAQGFSVRSEMAKYEDARTAGGDVGAEI